VKRTQVSFINIIGVPLLTMATTSPTFVYDFHVGPIFTQFVFPSSEAFIQLTHVL